MLEIGCLEPSNMDNSYPISIEGPKINLEDIINCMSGNVYWMDKNCVYLGCNDSAAKFAGLRSRQEAAGLTYEAMEKKAGWEAGVTAPWKLDDLEVIATGKPKLNVEEKPVLMPDGKELFYLTSRVPLLDDKGEVIGVVGMSVDITERKLMERELKLALERVEKAESEADEKTSQLMMLLAGSIAHEIRTPLAIIGINTDLLMMTPEVIVAKNKEKSAIGGYFENIKYAIGLAAQVVDNILTVLRVLSSGVPEKNKFERLSIDEDIEKLLAIYPFLDSEKSLVQVKFGKLKDFIYFGDKVLTQHALFNLFRNALHAIKEAEKGEIKITLEEGENHNILKFTDTALGISDELLPKIFDRFETWRIDGAGLGLTFCKMVMGSYGGEISCVSKKGKYTEFILSFPKIP